MPITYGVHSERALERPGTQRPFSGLWRFENVLAAG